MALNNKRETYIRAAKKTAFILLLLAWGAYIAFKFNAYTAANSAFVYNYRPPEDIFMKFRHPAPLAVYYTISDNRQPSMLVLPKSRMAEDEQINAHTADIIQAYHKSNKQICLLTQEKPQNIEIVNFYNKILVYNKLDAFKLEQLIKQECPLDKNLIIWLENLDSTSQTAGLSALKNLAKQQNLRPRLFNLIEKETLAQLEKRYAKPAEFSLVEQENNIKQFIADYGDELKSAITGKLPEKHSPLFDKVSVLATFENQDKTHVLGLPNNPQAIITAAKTLYDQILSLPQPDNIRFYASTDLFEQSVVSENDVLALLSPQKDGVLIKNGSRQAFILPSEWKKYPEKTDFLRHLKLQAGLSPDYWPPDTKIFLFRTVEILNNEN